MVLLPPTTWSAVLVAFVLFRIFDMWKPFPLRSLESLPSGWGIVADDLGAGLYALILSWPVMQWLPTF
jgi:phosphatidylglycerophosphatase A